MMSLSGKVEYARMAAVRELREENKDLAEMLECAMVMEGTRDRRVTGITLAFIQINPRRHLGQFELSAEYVDGATEPQICADLLKRIRREHEEGWLQPNLEDALNNAVSKVTKRLRTIGIIGDIDITVEALRARDDEDPTIYSVRYGDDGRCLGFQPTDEPIDSVEYEDEIEAWIKRIVADKD